MFKRTTVTNKQHTHSLPQHYGTARHGTLPCYEVYVCVVEVTACTLNAVLDLFGQQEQDNLADCTLRVAGSLADLRTVWQ